MNSSYFTGLRKRWRAWCGYVFMASVLLYVLSVFIPSQGFHDVLCLGSLVSLLVAFPDASRTSKVLSLLFLVFGFVFAVQSGSSPLHIFQSFGSMLSLLSLFSIVPLLAIPVKIGGYQHTVEYLLARRQLSQRKLYLTIGALSYLLGSLMNIAAIPMMYHSVNRVVDRPDIRNPKRFLVQSIVIGYAMPLTWSPVAAVVAAVVGATSVSWLAVLPITLALSLAGLLLGFLLFFGLQSTNPSTLDAPSSSRISATLEPAELLDTSAPKRRGIWQIGLAVTTFIVSMLAIQRGSGWSMIAVIAVLSIPFSWIWSALIHQSQQFFEGLKQHRTSVQNLHNTFAVFTAAGFFVQTLQQSKYIHSIDDSFVYVSQLLGPSVFIALIPVITVLLSLIGFHPVVSIALLGTSLHPAVLHMSPVWLSVALFGGGVLTFIISPFNATLNVTGNVSGENPSTIMKWNMKFCVCYLVLIMAVVAVGQFVS